MQIGKWFNVHLSYIRDTPLSLQLRNQVCVYAPGTIWYAEMRSAMLQQTAHTHDRTVRALRDPNNARR